MEEIVENKKIHGEKNTDEYLCELVLVNVRISLEVLSGIAMLGIARSTEIGQVGLNGRHVRNRVIRVLEVVLDHVQTQVR